MVIETFGPYFENKKPVEEKMCPSKRLCIYEFVLEKRGFFFLCRMSNIFETIFHQLAAHRAMQFVGNSTISVRHQHHPMSDFDRKSKEQFERDINNQTQHHIYSVQLIREERQGWSLVWKSFVFSISMGNKLFHCRWLRGENGEREPFIFVDMEVKIFQNEEWITDNDKNDRNETNQNKAMH